MEEAATPRLNGEVYGPTLNLPQPLRPCGPPPHKWGGASSKLDDFGDFQVFVHVLAQARCAELLAHVVVVWHTGEEVM